MAAPSSRAAAAARIEDFIGNTPGCDAATNPRPDPFSHPGLACPEEAQGSGIHLLFPAAKISHAKAQRRKELLPFSRAAAPLNGGWIMPASPERHCPIRPSRPLCAFALRPRNASPSLRAMG